MLMSNKLLSKLVLFTVLAFLMMIYIEVKNINDKHFFMHPTHLRISKTKQIPNIVQSTSTFLNTSRFWFETSNETKQQVYDCSDWMFPARVKGSENSQIILDPDRFLYPGLLWGPNNQIVGLKKAIYLAITLNRTLVVPSFNAHFTHSTTKLSPYQIIDVQRLCSFVPCISIKELRKRCDASFDVVFEARLLKYHHLKNNELVTGMNIMKPKRIWGNLSYARNLTFSDSTESFQIPTFPGANHLSRYGYRMPPDPVILRSVFNTTAPCAIYASVYNAIRIQPMNNVALPMTSLNKSLSDVSNEVLYSAITDAVHQPPCIVNAAKNYIRDVLSDREYVGVHWRYDVIDWMSRACRKPYRAWSRSVCVKLENIKPLHVARAIARALEKNSNALNLTIDTFFVYIAAPSTMNKFVDQIHEELLLIDGGYMKPSSTINSYLKEKFSSCWEKHHWKNIEEIVSLVEKEIMINSSWFFFSPISTWSENVRLYRIKLNEANTVRKLYEADVLQLALEEKNVRNRKSLFV